MDLQNVLRSIEGSRVLIAQLSQQLLFSSEDQSCNILAQVVREQSALHHSASKLTTAFEESSLVQKQAISRIRRYQNQKQRIIALPIEITSNIFYQGLPPFDSVKKSLRPLQLSGLEAYLCTITSVCHAWREIALDVPRLWGTLRCHTLGLDGFRDHWQLRLFQDLTTRLLLSKETPLELHWDLAEGYENALESPGIAPILPHCHRLQLLSITVYSFCSVLSTIVQQGLPRLSYLKLAIQNHGTFIPTARLIPPQSLKHVELECLKIEDESILLHYSLLTMNASHIHIKLGRHLKHLLPLILKPARDVEELVLEEVHIQSQEEHESESTVTLPKLIKLTCAPDQNFDVFSRIRCPALEILGIDNKPNLSSEDLLLLPTVHTLSSTSPATSRAIVQNLASHPHPLRSLSLVLELRHIVVLSELLDQRDNPRHWHAQSLPTMDYSKWKDLTEITLLITPDMLVGVTEPGEAPLDLFLASVRRRSFCCFVARVDRPVNRLVKLWLEKARENLGIRFSWIYSQ